MGAADACFDTRRTFRRSPMGVPHDRGVGAPALEKVGRGVLLCGVADAFAGSVSGEWPHLTSAY